MEFENGDILHQGWLTKSPPLETKKLLFNQSLLTPKWRRRWFILRQGGMPHQFLLQYYTDQNAKKLKGTIDLDQCEQVDTGLSYQSGKDNYQHLFDIKTPRRVFYLAADTEQEMGAWVEWICNICGLKTIYNDSVTDGQTNQLSPPNNNFVSGPYLHLADCFTGSKQPPMTKRGPNLKLNPPNYQNNPVIESLSSSVTTGDDSVFLPNPSPSSSHKQTFQNPGVTLTRRSSSEATSHPSVSNSIPQPPGRPPKPENLRLPLPSVPKEQPSGPVVDPVRLDILGIPAATSAPSSAPPVIDRTLKPSRGSLSSLELPGTCNLPSLPPPPSVPQVAGLWIPGEGRMCSPSSDSDSELVGLCRESVTSQGNNRNYVDDSEEEQIFFYMPSLQQSVGGRWDPLMIPATDVEQQVQYLDLDLPDSDERVVERKKKAEEETSQTVYKTVDFIKTEAFNRTRQKVEEYKYNIKPDGKQ